MNFSETLSVITGSNGILGTEVCKALRQQSVLHISNDISNQSPHDAEDTKDYHLKCSFADPQLLQEIKYLSDKYRKKYISILHFAGLDSKNVSANNTPYDLTSISFNYQLYNEMIHVNLSLTMRLVYNLLSLCEKESRHLNFIFVPSLYTYVAPNTILYSDPNDSPKFIQKPIEYIASKSALPSLMRYFTSTFSRFGHRFNCLVPHGFTKSVSPQFIQAFNHLSPVSRQPHLHEIIGPSLFLLSEESSYVNGQSLIVDGGWTSL